MLKASFPDIVGNDALRCRIAADVCSDTLSHAYIIEGAQGCGKHTLALEIAAALACENKNEDGLPLPCGHCHSCRKILEGKSPDVIYIHREKDKAQLGVDVIRALRENVRLLPNDLEQKIYIIEDAHTMNVQAQNALLLTLEEPPKFVVFLLLCNNTQTLLETIKSRAPILRMRPVSDDAISDFICKKHPEAINLRSNDKDTFNSLILSAEGSIGRALDLLSEKERAPIIRDRGEAQGFLEAASARKSGKHSVDIVTSFAQKPREDILKILQYVENAIRDLLLIKKSETLPLCFFTEREFAYELSSKFSSSTLMNIYHAVEDAQKRLSMNGNVRLVVFTLAVKCRLI